MVKEASDDQKLRSLGRSGGANGSSSSSTRLKTGSSRGSRSSWKGSSSDSGFNFGHSGNRSGFNSEKASNNRGGRRSMPFNFLLLEKERVGGRLSLFSHFWPSTSKDPWVLNSITEGSRIPFKSPPFQLFPGLNMVMSEDMANICDEEARSFLSKGAVNKISEREKGFVSGIFVIPKNSGGLRPIINLKGLNKFVKYQHFKMEGISVLKDMVREGDFFY